MTKLFSAFFLFCLLALLSENAEVKAQTRAEQSISSKSTSETIQGKSTPLANETEVNPSTYSKAGSDSVSLIIFGKIMVPNSTPKAVPSGTKTTAEASKDKKKEKFSIKSSDKLKTNNSLY